MSLGCAAAAAHADSITDYVHFEVGIGESIFQTRGNGTWYQEGFPYKMKLYFPAAEAGLTGDVIQRANWGVAWHLNYVWLGRVNSDAMATGDDNYNWQTHSCKRACTGSNTLARFVGQGNAQGIYFTLEPHYDYKGWRIGAEAGPFLDFSNWEETVYDYHVYNNGTPYVTKVHNNAAPQLSMVVGASIARGNFSLNYQYFFTKGRDKDPFPAIWRGTHVVMAKYRF